MPASAGWVYELAQPFGGVSTRDDAEADLERFVDACLGVDGHVARHAEVRLLAGSGVCRWFLLCRRLGRFDQRGQPTFHRRQIALEVLLFQHAVTERHARAADQDVRFDSLRLNRATARRVVTQRREA
jgi:hypothetical protein